MNAAYYGFSQPGGNARPPNMTSMRSQYGQSALLGLTNPLAKGSVNRLSTADALGSGGTDGMPATEGAGDKTLRQAAHQWRDLAAEDQPYTVGTLGNVPGMTTGQITAAEGVHISEDSKMTHLDTAESFYKKFLPDGMGRDLTIQDKEKVQESLKQIHRMADRWDGLITDEWARAIGQVEVMKMTNPEVHGLEEGLYKWKKSIEQVKADFINSEEENIAIELELRKLVERRNMLSKYRTVLLQAYNSMGNNVQPMLPMGPIDGSGVSDLTSNVARFTKGYQKSLLKNKGGDLVTRLSKNQ